MKSSSGWETAGMDVEASVGEYGGYVFEWSSSASSVVAGNETCSRCAVQRLGEATDVRIAGDASALEGDRR